MTELIIVMALQYNDRKTMNNKVCEEVRRGI